MREREGEREGERERERERERGERERERERERGRESGRWKKKMSVMRNYSDWNFPDNYTNMRLGSASQQIPPHTYIYRACMCTYTTTAVVQSF